MPQAKHEFTVKNEKGEVSITCTTQQKKLVDGFTDLDELINKCCESDKILIKICQCQKCRYIQSYYFESSRSIQVDEGDSYCYMCEDDVDWDIITTVQMMEVMY